MSKAQKVVTIKEDHCETAGKGECTSRIIFGIGKQRIAFDFTTRVKDLPPRTGDQPARVLPIKKGAAGKPK